MAALNRAFLIDRTIRLDMLIRVVFLINDPRVTLDQGNVSMLVEGHLVFELLTIVRFIRSTVKDSKDSSVKSVIAWHVVEAQFQNIFAWTEDFR